MRLVASYDNLTIECDLIKLEQDNMPYIEMLNSIKTDYAQGEEVSVLGGKIKFFDTTKDGAMVSKEVTLTKEMISDFSTQEPGEYKMTITYSGCTLKLTYTVIADIDVEALYCNNLGLAGEGYYEYAKFNSKTSVRFWNSIITPPEINSSHYGDISYSIVRSVENGKVVYTNNVSSSDQDIQIKITVESQDHIIVSAIENGDNVAISLYKYYPTNN